jgi:RimJ/RimL family protein N-acetyltransferase
MTPIESRNGKGSKFFDRRAISIRLRDVEPDDLAVLYSYQLEPIANQLACTLLRSPAVFDAHWADILNDLAVVVKAIDSNGVLAGCISCFKSDGLDLVGYWLGAEFWGNGIATRALSLLLQEVSNRPLYARVATSNLASLRVLAKCGFEVTRYQLSPANDRYLECEEAVLELR